MRAGRDFQLRAGPHNHRRAPHGWTHTGNLAERSQESKFNPWIIVYRALYCILRLLKNVNIRHDGPYSIFETYNWAKKLHYFSRWRTAIRFKKTSSIKTVLKIALFHLLQNIFNLVTVTRIVNARADTKAKLFSFIYIGRFA